MQGLKNVALVIVVVLVSFISVTYTSCKKEEQSSVGPCTGVVCSNGSCIEGRCYCIVGFEGDKCDKSSKTRYFGKWAVTETVKGSNKPANKNLIRNYTLTIKNDPSTNVSIFFDNLMGNVSNNNVVVYISTKYNETEKIYENDIPANFIFYSPQKIQGTNINIGGGKGNITSTDNGLYANYTVNYVEGSMVVFDTVSFSADYIQ